MIDVSGLAALDKSAVFMDADNKPHQLTAEQIKILRREIVEGGNFSYQQKWDLRNQIKSAETKEELEKTMDPSKYTGRASVQVDAFLKNVVNPVLEANKEALGMTAEINV